MPATLHFLIGEAAVSLGEDTHDVKAGAIVQMQPKLTHGIVARTPMMMLLFQLKAARQA
jgi:quercetin dioxygenase-like cupin family protein